jgi:hypothetical protein
MWLAYLSDGSLTVAEARKVLRILRGCASRADLRALA